MKKYCFFLIVFSALLSCGGSQVPSGILPPEQMQTILWQLMQTDEYTSDAFSRDSTKNLTTERIKRYRQVFQLNQTTREDFQKSYRYYMAHPDITKPMFDSLSARAIRQREEQEKHPKPVLPVHADTIKPVTPVHADTVKPVKSLKPAHTDTLAPKPATPSPVKRPRKPLLKRVSGPLVK